VVQEIDQGALGGAMDGAIGSSGNSRKSVGWFERWIREQ
jgi:hypothetical protein